MDHRSPSMIISFRGNQRQWSKHSRPRDEPLARTRSNQGSPMHAHGAPTATSSTATYRRQRRVECAYRSSARWTSSNAGRMPAFPWRRTAVPLAAATCNADKVRVRRTEHGCTYRSSSALLAPCHSSFTHAQLTSNAPDNRPIISYFFLVPVWGYLSFFCCMGGYLSLY